MPDAIGQYDEAWNTDDETRRKLLDSALTDDCELIEPRGRFVGRDAICGRIDGFASRFPGARVNVISAIDEHNGFARYAWEIRSADGAVMLDGIDVVERAPDSRLARVVMFFGPLAPRSG